MRILKQKSISFKFAAIIPVLLLAFLYSCEEPNTIESQIIAQETSLKIQRFDLEFRNAQAGDLAFLKQKYPFFFPTQTPDSIWKLKLEDPIQDELLDAVAKTFPNLDSMANNMTHLYGHFRYYFPKETTIPKIYTLTNEVVHDYRVIATDAIWLVALDNYLGVDHDFYRTFPNYIREEKDPKYILTDLAAALALNMTPKEEQSYFLASIVYEGKKLLLQELLWPHVSPALQLHYSELQYQWVLENEAQIWRHFIENDLLYSTEKALLYRFIGHAPFSKFNLEIDKESSPRVGQFIGLQLVRSYYNAQNKDLYKVMMASPVTILKDASYKPKK